MIALVLYVLFCLLCACALHIWAEWPFWLAVVVLAMVGTASWLVH